MLVFDLSLNLIKSGLINYDQSKDILKILFDKISVKNEIIIEAFKVLLEHTEQVIKALLNYI